MAARWARTDYGAYGVQWPGTKRRGACEWLRSPRTTQERRWYDQEFGRAKRNARRLVDSWDDIPRQDAGDRSWKRHRRTQYRPVDM